ncbi:MAG TPA: glycosyltransferase family 4 protein [Candidatus Sulfotelmatobacter sp.]|nr:glycosyltransferase family 4 protein [Candidatus Sulfotelmatobacter sp.]
MNILILNWRDTKNPKSGGAELVTLEHAKAWVKKGHKVTWFTSEFEGSKKEEKIDSVNIIRRGNYLTVFFYAPFFYLFSRNEFDLVIDEIHGIPFFTPLYVRKPKIAFIHEVADEIWDYMYPFPFNKIGKILERLIFVFYKNVKFMTASNSTKAVLKKFGIKEKNITVIISGLSDKPINKLPIKEKLPTFIFVSRVVKMKGIEEVVKAYFHILRSVKDANLWIVGNGEKKYVNSLKKMMESYSISTKVKFFGHVSNDKKLELMRKSQLLLHASVKEGWGLVVIEAASQGTPSVVYNVAGLKDSVVNDKTGIVISKNIPSELGERAMELLENKKKYYIFQKNGIQRAKSLKWEKSVSQSLVLIEKTANNE